MLAGRVPFKGASEYLTFNAIENRTFIFPDPFPDVAKDLINQLLVCILSFLPSSIVISFLLLSTKRIWTQVIDLEIEKLVMMN